MGALKGIAENANDRPAVDDRREDIMAHVKAYLNDKTEDMGDRLAIQCMAVEAAGALIINAKEEDATKKNLVEILIETGDMELKAPDLRVAVIEQFKNCARTKYECIADIIDVVVPFLLKYRESSNTRVKYAATRALIHVLAIHTDTSVVSGYSGPEKKAVNDCVKSLLKQKADSDEEEVGHRVF